VIDVGYISYVEEVVANDVLVANDRGGWYGHGWVTKAQGKAQPRIYLPTHRRLTCSASTRCSHAFVVCHVTNYQAVNQSATGAEWHCPHWRPTVRLF